MTTISPDIKEHDSQVATGTWWCGEKRVQINQTAKLRRDPRANHSLKREILLNEVSYEVSSCKLARNGHGPKANREISGLMDGVNRMEFYLDIHAGETSEDSVSGEHVRELLLQDGAQELENGTVWFADAMVIVSSTRRKQQDRADEESVTRLLQAAGLPVPAEEETSADRDLVSFRYSWATSPESLRDSIGKLLDFCQHHSLRLYDSQAERYVSADTLDVAVESLGLEEFRRVQHRGDQRAVSGSRIITPPRRIAYHWRH